MMERSFKTRSFLTEVRTFALSCRFRSYPALNQPDSDGMEKYFRVVAAQASSLAFATRRLILPKKRVRAVITKRSSAFHRCCVHGARAARCLPGTPRGFFLSARAYAQALRQATTSRLERFLHRSLVKAVTQPLPNRRARK